jgi:PBSX family phage terminase large subunit
MGAVEFNVTPTQPQSDFLNSNAKFRLFFSGAGAGKSYVSCTAAIIYCLQNPKCRGAMIAQSYPAVRDVLVATMEELLPEGVAKYNAAKHEMKFINGSTIIFKGANDNKAIESLRGLNLNFFAIDEAAIIDRKIWDILIGRLRRGDNLKAWLTTTPRIGWCYEKFILNENTLGDEYYILKDVPTTTNTFLPTDYIESVKAEYGEDSLFYQQEVLGRFVKFDGAIYDIQNKTVPAGDLKNLTFDRYIYGVDFGFTHPCGVVVIGVHGQTMYVVDEFSESGITDGELAKILHELHKKYRTGKIYCDSALPGSIKTLADSGLNATNSNKSVLDGIRTVTNLFNTDSLYISDECTQLIHELQNYAWRDGKDEPIKIMDDLSDALRYALHTSKGTGDSSRFLNVKVKRR